MIACIEGRGVGSGKSYMVMEILMPHWIQGGTACVSDNVEIKWDGCVKYAKERARVVLQPDQYRVIRSSDVVRLHEVTPPGTADLPVILVVDEAQDAFNARDWGDKGKRAFFSWLCQSRHDDNDVYILSQAAANVDKQVRRLCTFYWVTRNTEYFPVGGKSLADWFRIATFGLWDGKAFIRTQLDQDGKTVLGKKWHRADKGLFACYESKSMRLKHRRDSAEVVRKKLETVERKKTPMFRIVAVFVVMAAILGGGKLLFGSKSKPREVAVNLPSKPHVADAPIPFDSLKDGAVVWATARAVSSSFVDSVEYGLMAIGDRTPEGFIECVLPGGVVKVRSLSNRSVTIRTRPISFALATVEAAKP